jgi:hypothetical protein
MVAIGRPSSTGISIRRDHAQPAQHDVSEGRVTTFKLTLSLLTSVGGSAREAVLDWQQQAQVASTGMSHAQYDLFDSPTLTPFLAERMDSHDEASA